MDGKKKQYFLGALLSYGTIIFNIISGLIYTPWMISTIGKEHYALYTLASSVITLFLMDFGIGGAVSKFLANYYANKQYDEANKFMGIVYKIFIFISVIVAACLFVFYFFIGGIYAKLSPNEITIFKHLFIIVSVYSVLSFPFITFNGILMANELFIEIKACNFGQKFLNVLLIVLCLLFGGNVYALVIVHAFSNVFFIILKYFIIKNKTLLKVEFKFKNRQTMKSLFDYSVWMTVMSLAQRLIFNIMPSLIAALIGSVQVTMFSLASVIEGYVFTFTDAINGMFLPKISRIIVGENAKENLSALLCKVGKFHVYTLGLMFVGFVCVGKEFVNLWLGDGYEMVYICAVILILPSLIDTPQQIAKTALLATDVVKEQGIIYLVMAVCNIVLAAILLPTVGIVGGAVSVCIAYFVRTVCLNVLYHKKLHINLKKYFKTTYGVWLIVVLLVSIIYFIVTSKIYFDGWIGFLIKSFIVFVLYVFLLLIAILTKKDNREMLKRIIKRVAKK